MVVEWWSGGVGWQGRNFEGGGKTLSMRKQKSEVASARGREHGSRRPIIARRGAVGNDTLRASKEPPQVAYNSCRYYYSAWVGL